MTHVWLVAPGDGFGLGRLRKGVLTGHRTEGALHLGGPRCIEKRREQWQDELWHRFHISFEILTNQMVEAARTGNPFAEGPLWIARLDHLSRNEDLQAKLAAVDWDLIVVDEAHKMSADYFGAELKETRRYRLGKLAGSISRHFLLMTATPHSGKEADFQLFMALLDTDRLQQPDDRDEGVALVHRYDGEFPAKYFNEILEYLELTEEQWWETVDSFRPRHLWDRVGGEWRLKHRVS